MAGRNRLCFGSPSDFLSTVVDLEYVVAAFDVEVAHPLAADVDECGEKNVDDRDEDSVDEDDDDEDGLEVGCDGD